MRIGKSIACSAFALALAAGGAIAGTQAEQDMSSSTNPHGTAEHAGATTGEVGNPGLNADPRGEVDTRTAASGGSSAEAGYDDDYQRQYEKEQRENREKSEGDDS
jgi:hypothetical protein